MSANHWVAVLVLAGTVTTSLAPVAWARGEPDAQALAQASNQFAFGLYARLREGQGNLFFSPHSLHAALSMTALGAKGRTADEMASVLGLVRREHLPAQGDAPAPWVVRPAPEEARAYGFLLGGTPVMKGINAKPGADQRGFELVSVNALWGQQGYPFLPAYLESVRGIFGGDLRSTDFVADPEGSRTSINTWVEDQTQHRIKQLLQRGVIDRLTRLVLTNAVYFKAPWDHPFRKEATSDGDFTLADGKRVKTALMRQTETFGYVEQDGFQVLEIPYSGREVSMLVLLPRKADGLAGLEKTLTPERVSQWAAGVKPQRVDLTLPKFRTERDVTLNETLKALGMPAAFDPGQADFSNMAAVQPGELRITAVVHQAFVDVNEAGTEAAAATAVVIGLRSAMASPPVVFRADRPFVYLIRHKPTGTILFLGRLVEPG